MFTFRKIEIHEPFIDNVFQLRYQVYCVEWGFEKPEDHPGQMERDEFDEQSAHFAAVRDSDNMAIGTVRLILPSGKGFPIEGHCQLTADLGSVDKTRIGEISRLAVSKEYRKRQEDKVVFNEGEIVEASNVTIGHERRRMENDIVLNLYTCLYKESMRRGFTHLYGVMAEGLYKILRRIGIEFEQIGPSVEYHGKRTPYILDLTKMINTLKVKNPVLHDNFTSGG